MKAVYIEQFGLEHLTIRETDKPQIAADEILVEVRAFALNHLDILLIEGHYNPNLSLPHVPGSDAAGTVVVVGEKVVDFQVGDEVVTHFFIDWQSGSFRREYFDHRYGSEGQGVFAQYIAVSPRGVVKKPDHLTFAEAATLPIAGLTAWCSVIEEVRLLPGQNIVILGTGGVSVFAIQMAQLIGLNVAVVAGSEKAISQTQALGISHVFNYRTHPHWEERLLAVMPNGADLVLDVVGDIERSMKVLAVGGIVKVVGFVGTSISPFNVFEALMNHANVIASTPGSRESFHNLLLALHTHSLRPVIDRMFAFDQTREALAYLKQGGHFGKVVVSVS